MNSRVAASATAGLVVSLVSMAAGVVIWKSKQAKKDGRSWRRPPRRRFSIRRNQFALAASNPALFDGWFRDTFRCSWQSFEGIVSLVEAEWDSFHGPIHHNARFFVRERVAVLLHYVTHSGAIVDSAKVFGMSRSSAFRFIEEVLDIIIDRMGPRFISLPKSNDEWQELADGLERVCNFPDACLAIDGSLIQIERPFDYEGWYCRKGYPAINAQCVVDYKQRFRSYALRPGAENDKGIFNRSEFGRTIHQILPPDKVILADAGYQLYAHCLTPYEIHDKMTPEEKNYNYLHSRTRITVENAFGLLKNRFRRFKAPLNQRGSLNNGWHRSRTIKTASAQASRIIRAALILHNVYIDLNDDVPIDIEPENGGEMTCVNENDVEAPPGAIDGEHAKRRRDIFKVYLSSINHL